MKETRVSTTTRTLAATSAAAITGTVLAVSGIGAAPAQAAGSANHITVSTQAKAHQVRARVVSTAKRQVGERYITGHTGPGAFDCSGLVVFSYKRATGRTLPRTSYQQRGAIQKIRPANRMPGDLVFFNGNGHVAIYVGHDRIVHAANSRSGVRTDRVAGWYRSTLVGYGRVIRAH